jgi:maltase-glucoamylase
MMSRALHIRYTLLPYYYTLFYKAHTQGSTVVCPLFHEFATDKNTLDIFLQFLVGSHMMLAPVTDADARPVQVYFPSSDWYDYYTGVPMLAEK